MIRFSPVRVAALAFVMAALPAYPQGTCPAGTVAYAGYCFAQAAVPAASHATTCAAHGLQPTVPNAPMVWDATALNAVAAGLGHSSIGIGGCCAVQAFCNESTDECLSDNWGSYYENWQGERVGWLNVYSCQQAAAVAPAPVPMLDGKSLAMLAVALLAAALLIVRRLS
jgi:hypothetical protein